LDLKELLDLLDLQELRVNLDVKAHKELI